MLSYRWNFRRTFQNCHLVTFFPESNSAGKPSNAATDDDDMHLSGIFEVFECGVLNENMMILKFQCKNSERFGPVKQGLRWVPKFLRHYIYSIYQETDWSWKDQHVCRYAR